MGQEVPWGCLDILVGTPAGLGAVHILVEAVADLGVGRRLGTQGGIPGILGDTVVVPQEGQGTRAGSVWLGEVELGGAQGEGLQVHQEQGEEMTPVGIPVGTVVVPALCRVVLEHQDGPEP